MNELLVHIPAALTMLVLLAFSAFFSCSEAAYFSLNKTDREKLAERGHIGKLAVSLAEKPEPLLNSVLLGNLFVNLLIFTISTILTFQIGEKSPWAWTIAAASLLAVIIFGEVLPKNFGVTAPHFFALSCAVPLTLLVNLLHPVLPLLNKLNILSRRVMFPDFEAEPYLLAGDLERAVALSGEDAALLKREQRSIQNIVSLSEMRAEELMRPRSLLKIFKPGVSFDEVMNELRGTLPLSGYCLLSEPDSEEIAAALCFARVTAKDVETSWHELFEPVIYVPWSSPAAEVFERLQQKNLRLAVVINELGETVGIITLDDIMATIFTREQGRSRRLLNRFDIQRIYPGKETAGTTAAPAIWELTGLTSLRRLQRQFGQSFDAYSSLTVGGLLREMLERFPKAGDTCQAGNLQFNVIAVGEGNDLIVHLQEKARVPLSEKDTASEKNTARL